MAAWTIRAENLKALRKFEWSPSGVCALVGPNGSGKSTALKLMHFVTTALKSGYDEALRIFGTGPIRCLQADGQGGPSILLASETLRFELALERTTLPRERLSSLVDTLYERSMRGNPESLLLPPGGSILRVRNLSDQLLLREVTSEMGQDAVSFKRGVEHSLYLSRPDLSFLRLEGSAVSNRTELDPQARHLFTVLRNWRDQSDFEERFGFVMEGMAECFPSFKRLNFVGWGPRQGAEIPQSTSNEHLQPSDWSDGFLSTLCLLTATASVERGVLAIDELENSLHPELIVRVMELLREWSRKKDVTITLATHSPVVLDQFRDEPERVFVMQPGADQQPVALDKLKKRDWLQHFSIGDLYSHGEVGAPG